MRSRSSTTSRPSTRTSTWTPTCSNGLRRSAQQSFHAHVALAELLLGGCASAPAEQALGEQQIDHDRDVEDQREDLERAHLVRQLVELEWQESHGRDEGQVFGPA